MLSTIGVMVIGVLLGAIAGYYRGWQDTIISRVTDVTMAFPTLLFLIALTATVGPRLDGITFGIFERGVVTLVLVFTLFGWFAPCRIMRAQTLSVREKEYIEAAQMVGASDWRVLRSHVIPHLVAPIIVFSTLIVAAYVGLEAGLSFLGLGIKIAHRELGQPARGTLPQFYTPAAVADGLAGHGRASDHARLQPAGRRPEGRVRPALQRTRVAVTRRFGAQS